MRELEKGYELAWKRHCSGLPPANIEIPSLEHELSTADEAMTREDRKEGDGKDDGEITSRAHGGKPEEEVKEDNLMVFDLDVEEDIRFGIESRLVEAEEGKGDAVVVVDDDSEVDWS